MQTTTEDGISPDQSRTEPGDREYFNIKMASQIIRARHGLVVGPRKLREAIQRGELQAIRANERGDLYTSNPWLDEFLERFVERTQIQRQIA